MKRYVLIVAGGQGLRMGKELPKQFLPLAGRPVLMRTLECFYDWDAAADLILALPTEQEAYWQMLCRELDCRAKHRTVAGGATRFQSVANALALVEQPGLVAVHDGVRPFVTAALIEACFEEAERNGAAVPLLPMTDSLRETIGQGLSRPLDRRRFMAVQTPQVFRSEYLVRAYRQDYCETFTDDASVVEALGVGIHSVAGDRRNIKITHPLDLLLAEALLNNPS